MRYLVPFIFLLVIASCKAPQDPPVFKKVDNIRVTKVTGDEAVLSGNAFFFNPNKVGMTLRKVNIDVMLEGKKIGTINQETKTQVPANSDFSVPVDATFNIGDVGLLNSILSVLGGKKMKAQYVGNIKLTVHGVPIKVSIDYEEEIRLR